MMELEMRKNERIKQLNILILKENLEFLRV